MSMNHKESLEVLLDLCRAVQMQYEGYISAADRDINWYQIWDDFVDALEAIEEGMK